MNDEPVVIAPGERLLRMKQMLELKLGGTGESTVYRMMAKGRFPRPLVLGGVSLWPESVINKYLGSLPRAKSKPRAESPRLSLAPGVRSAKKRKPRSSRTAR